LTRGFFICGGIFDLKQKEEEIQLLETRMEKGDFWEQTEEAKRVIQQCNRLKAWTVPYKELQERLENIKALYPDAESSGDQSFIEELFREIESMEKTISDLEMRRMLSGEMDDKDCFLSVNAGAGGTEACDWALMLCRMYQRWASRRGWKIEVIDTVEGEVAGVKSMTFRFAGAYAYGFCKAEKGVHRLVRISPFDSNAKRHTSFASVDVTPDIADEIQIDVRPEDLRIETYRASGAGGQHVNKTDSAVRITHIPSGIVVSSQKERSQLQNKELCLKLLRAKLYEREVLSREQKIQQMGDEKKEISFGSQIRNYVFHPYTLVKDTRTKHEEGNIAAVMDGDLDPFVNLYLKEYST
jgi:peptide chain release factor 2